MHPDVATISVLDAFGRDDPPGARDRMSVLHVLAPGEEGGLESVVRALAIGQRGRGHAVRVAAVVDAGCLEHPFVASLDEAGVETATLAIPSRAYFREGAFVADLCRRHSPDVVHTHGFRADVLDAAVARRLGVPTITTVHGFTGGGWRVGVYERIQRRAFRSFGAVAAVSRPLAERLAAGGLPRDRVHVVPNAYAPRRRSMDRAAARRTLSIPDDHFVVGWVGRLGREKGADVLIDALPRLPAGPLLVSVLGDGPEAPALRARARVLGVEERVRWHGLVRDASAVFRAFDVLVLSSRTEGCPMVLLEAMAAGVPIVASRVGGVPDILSPAEASLVPPEDPEALARAVLEVYRDRAGAASRARAAFERLEAEFRPAAWIARYEALYRRIRKGPAGSAS